jgi:predicted MFS family arabinose efflux permease
MTDALMVEVGRPLGLTGSFQALQWASISLAFTLAQFGGGYLSAHATAQTAFLLAAGFPLVTLIGTLKLVREPKTIMNRESLQETGTALWQAAQSRTVWIVAGFLFFWNFSPSLGTPLLYYETDVLRFSKVFIGALGALSNAAGMLGALLFFAYCREIPLDRLLFFAVALGVAATLGFIGLSGPKSAILLFFLFGTISQITHLAVLDLAARSCPVRAEGTVFALLMSSLNVGRTGSTFLGGWLYDYLGLTPLILVSAGFTALCWLLVPFLRGGITRPENIH